MCEMNVYDVWRHQTGLPLPYNIYIRGLSPQFGEKLPDFGHLGQFCLKMAPKWSKNWVKMAKIWRFLALFFLILSKNSKMARLRNFYFKAMTVRKRLETFSPYGRQRRTKIWAAFFLEKVALFWLFAPNIWPILRDYSNEIINHHEIRAIFDPI